ncbi:MAG: riboflavin synthase [Myxococcales bacterium]|nr:riboflavin synthase [Myxococcales bacterium]
MFTGLVEQVGEVRRIERGVAGSSLRIASTFEALVLGESIAVNGVCLTVTQRLEDGFLADASAETLSRTTLGGLATGSKVHLERAVRLGDRMGGHLVTGHVDGVAKIVQRVPSGGSLRMTFEVPGALAPFLAPKGSVAVDGVSLTVNGVAAARFEVTLVPFTLKETTFAGLQAMQSVNIEVDVLAKYVASLLGKPGVDGAGGGVSLDLLREQGYLGP